MNTKLTLVADEKLIAAAKRFAKQKGTSLSALISSYLKAITQESESSSSTKAPITKGLSGRFKSMNTQDDKQGLTEALTKKYDVD
jgi:hypothetical protein